MRTWILLSVLLLATWLGVRESIAKPPLHTWGSAAPIEPESLPQGLLPPGAHAPDPGPSRVIFPPQSIPLRFDHRAHMRQPNVTCVTCHTNAQSSTVASDSLLPPARTCDACHGTSHAQLGAVKAGPALLGACATCHEGYEPAHGNHVAAVRIPTPNLRFDHKLHAARNIGCGQCHGDVGKLGKATRDQMPRMEGCLRCHDGEPVEVGGALGRRLRDAHPASGVCVTCHLSENAVNQRDRSIVEGPRRALGGASTEQMATHFSSGTLLPSRALGGAAHDAEFLRRHKAVAAADSRMCATCHKEEFCADCHDGRVRPRSIHPNDYLSMHAIDARQMTQNCQSCHREQSFCLGCHQRLGVSQSGPLAGRESGRFHPPKSVFSDLPRGPMHHAQEAARNLNACVSCHIERDCVACHGGKGIGGGFNPHPAGFSASCDRAYARNPRPCLTCHDLGATELERCR